MFSFTVKKAHSISFTAMSSNVQNLTEFYKVICSSYIAKNGEIIGVLFD